MQTFICFVHAAYKMHARVQWASIESEKLFFDLQICLSGALQVDECAADTHDCWRGSGKSACVDTFRGYVCECPRGTTSDNLYLACRMTPPYRYSAILKFNQPDNEWYMNFKTSSSIGVIQAMNRYAVLILNHWMHTEMPCKRPTKSVTWRFRCILQAKISVWSHTCIMWAASASLTRGYHKTCIKCSWKMTLPMFYMMAY